MSMAMFKQCCGDCRHWNEEEANNDVAECRRYPPVLVAPVECKPYELHDIAKRTMYPVVSYVQTCGEWAAIAAATK